MVPCKKKKNYLVIRDWRVQEETWGWYLEESEAFRPVEEEGTPINIRTHAGVRPGDKKQIPFK